MLQHDTTTKLPALYFSHNVHCRADKFGYHTLGHKQTVNGIVQLKRDGAR